MPPRTKRRTLREYAAALGFTVGCHDGGCVWGHPDGVTTNGGCDCLKADARELRLHLITMARVSSLLARDHDGLLVP